MGVVGDHNNTVFDAIQPFDGIFIAATHSGSPSSKVDRILFEDNHSITVSGNNVHELPFHNIPKKSPFLAIT